VDKFSSLYGTNSPYIEDLYQQYQQDPASVPDNWRAFFGSLGDASPATVVQTGDGLAAAPATDKQSRVSQLIQAFRNYGHKRAHLNPLATKPELDDDLKPIAFGLTVDDMDQSFATEGVLPAERATLREIFEALKETYCGSIGVQFYDLPHRAERLWLQQQMESVQNKPQQSKEVRQRILKGLMVAEKFEQFLHKKFVGAKRFSLEGGESMIPMLDVMIDAAGQDGVTDIVMGMAHRGRLNVLANILNKPYAAMFSEFAGTVKINEGDASMGDVKYHMGKSFDITTSKGYDLHVALLPNPSHLEAVNPVVMGNARARQHIKGDKERIKVLPLLIHGDAAFIGQGVVAESLIISTVDGYNTGGIVHLVINNQIGFTANPSDGFGTEYCTDFARMLQVPIFHVNGDDPEACAHVMQLAMEYRRKFKRDVVIDLVCYRRYGHNEGDDPTFTQPLMYQKIKAHETTYNLYVNQVVTAGTFSDAEVKETEDAFAKRLNDDFETASKDGFKPTKEMFGGAWEGLSQARIGSIKTAIAKKDIDAVSKALMTWPKDFTPNSKVAKIIEKRADSLTAGGMDWGSAEMAAYGSLLAEGFSVRLSGQDAKRGTFSHRHAVMFDAENGNQILPISQMAAKGATMEVHNSPLSEEAVLGFEYGYALADPKTLTIWEAQFGDFSNSAQIIIDQFIASSEAKWDRLTGLVMLLPHGFEGQGPEHSSARLERYLQLCANGNMTVANYTTPAQIFHALRRQMHAKTRRPLIVMSPKSLLRHPKAVSSLDDLTKGSYQSVIDDAHVTASKVERVVFCSGKVYYDLLARQEEDKNGAKVALVRVEQLHPLAEEALQKIIKSYAKAKDIVWAQEEPRNQGAWTYMLDALPDVIGKPIRFIGRVASASPAVGSLKRHAAEQEAIVAEVFKF
jgi:2-oxoglutarate dehydrogenase E1 component